MNVFEPFLVGRHKCIGQKFAWAEMRLTLACLIYRFDISSASTEGLRDFGDQKTFIFWEKQPLKVRLKPRC
jgi:cytochrome P450